LNYTEDVKKEIYKVIKTKSIDQQKSYLMAITKSLAQIKAFEKGDSFLTYEIKDETLAYQVSELLIDLYSLEHEVEEVASEPILYVISLSKSKANKMLEEMSLSHFENGKYIEKENEAHIAKISNMEKAEGYLQGIFVSLGNVYFPREGEDETFETKERGYHLEMVFFEKEHAIACQNMLSRCKISLSFINREQTFSLYTKSSENISDVLAFLGASSAVLKLNNVSIQRSINNEINRRSNAEAANIDKTISANAKYTEAIKILYKRIGRDNINDDKMKLVCEARLNDKTSSMSALAEQLHMTKSSLNRMLNKIVKIAQKLEE